MVECYDIILRPDDGTNPTGLLSEIVDEVKKLLTASGDAAGSYVKGKDQKELARAEEIRAKIYEKIGQVEIERQRLIQQRDEAIHKAQFQRERDRDAQGKRTQELEAQRVIEGTKIVREVVDCIKNLQKLGMKVEINVFEGALSDLCEDRMS